MRLIIAGSRTFTGFSSTFILEILCLHKISPHSKSTLMPEWKKITEIVSGGANGIDALGERFAKNYDIELIEFPAEWYKFGKAAGPKRNAEMAKYADALLLIWDGRSKGSASMKALMEKQGKPIYEVILK